MFTNLHLSVIQLYKFNQHLRLFFIVFFSVCFFTKCSNPSEPELGFSEKKVFSTHIEIDVRYKSSDGVILSGTLLLPPANSLDKYPAVVAHFGSDRWTRYRYNGWTKVWLDRDIAVLTYDKRGVGESGGECCPFSEPGYFPLLAEDVLAGVRILQTRDDIDSSRIGLYGFSQGGWIVPIAAAIGKTEIAFSIIGSGPTVTLGEELLYSELSGEDDCERSDLSDEEIEQLLDEAGPSEFDPKPYLEKMTTPGFWMYGGNDISLPVKRSVKILEKIKDDLNKDWDIKIFPNINHVFIIGGGPCEYEGVTYNWVTPAFNWLLLKLNE